MIRIFLIYLILKIIIINGENNEYSKGYGVGIVFPGSKCLNYVGDSIGQPLCNNRLFNGGKKIYSTVTLVDNKNISSQELSKIEILKSFEALTFLQDQCDDLLFTQFGLCDLNFSPCVETIPKITPLQNVSLPQRLCKSVCERMVSNCPRLSLKIDCSISFLFPEIGTEYNLTLYGYTENKGLYKVPCIDPTDGYNNISNQMELIQACPYPLLLKNSSDPKYSPNKGYTYLPPTNCVLTCPMPNYTKTQWKRVYDMAKTLSSISFICACYNILTFGILNRKRKSKYNICITLMSTSIALVYLTDIIKFGYGIEEFLCPEPGRSAVQNDAACGITGAMFHFGITYCCCWAMTMSIVLFCSVKRIKLFYFRHFMIGNTIFTIITTVILLSAKKMVAGTGYIECWVRERWFVFIKLILKYLILILIVINI